jgi:hypothetical protein
LWIPLEVFLAGLYPDGRTIQNVWEVDGRVVIGCVLPSGGSKFKISPAHKCVRLGGELEGIMRDWAGMLSGRKDFWIMAEEVIEERKKRCGRYDSISVFSEGFP